MSVNDVKRLADISGLPVPTHRYLADAKVLIKQHPDRLKAEQALAMVLMMTDLQAARQRIIGEKHQELTNLEFKLKKAYERIDALAEQKAALEKKVSDLQWELHGDKAIKNDR